MSRKLSKIILVAVLAGLFCLPGCVTDSGLDRRVQELESQMYLIRRQVRQKDSSTQGSAVFKANATAKLDALERQLTELKGALDKLQHQLGVSGASGQAGAAQVTLAALAARMARIERRLGIKPPATAPVASKPATPARPTTPVKPTAPAVPKPTAPVPVKPKTAPKPVTPSESYNSAYRLFKTGKYAGARAAFESFLKKHPKDPKASNAQFWIGECYYYQRRYEESVLSYNKVLKLYPHSGKVPSAMLKQAFAFEKLGDKMSSRILLRRVIRRFPGTSQAKIARAKLKTTR